MLPRVHVDGGTNRRCHRCRRPRRHCRRHNPRSQFEETPLTASQFFRNVKNKMQRANTHCTNPRYRCRRRHHHHGTRYLTPGRYMRYRSRRRPVRSSTTRKNTHSCLEIWRRFWALRGEYSYALYFFRAEYYVFRTRYLLGLFFVFATDIFFKRNKAGYERTQTSRPTLRPPPRVVWTLWRMFDEMVLSHTGTCLINPIAINPPIQ